LGRFHPVVTPSGNGRYLRIPDIPVMAGTARLRKIAVVPGARGGWLNALLLVLSADAFTRREVLRAASETRLAATLRNNPIG
jgi:hypothetical protein